MQGGESIEPSTMNYVFDMFGKSVAQMLQSSLGQQTMIDELRAQLRSVQTQVTNVCNTLEDFEDKLFIKVQEMRPTIYTRDGIPIDDALEMLQSKIAACADKTQNQGEVIEKLDSEIKAKLDSEQFEKTFKESSQAAENYQEIFLTIQTLQKEMQKQRADSDSINDRVMQMLQLKLEQYANTKSFSMDDETASNEEYVKQSTFEQEIARIKQNPFGLPGFDSFVPTGNKVQDQFTLLQMQQDQLEAAYKAQKTKLGTSYDNLIASIDGTNGLGEEEDFANFSDDFLIESDFEYVNTEPDKTIEFRSISVDNEGNVDDEQIYTGKRSGSSRRSMGLQCNVEKKRPASKAALLEALKAKKAEHEASINPQKQAVFFDEGKMQSTIISNIMGKVENMLVDFFSMQSGLKLDKNDAKALVSQLSLLQDLKESIAKLKILMKTKKDTVTCDKELEIRITRNDFFNYLATIFPNNQFIQKCLTNIRNGLPPLKKDAPASRPKSTAEDDVKGRAKTPKTVQPNLVPARNSRLLALNQKFLRGADGRYYLRDTGGEASLVMAPSITGTSKKEVQAEEAFDFQPFTPATNATPKQESNDRPGTSAKHRSKTPTDSTD